MREHRPQQRKPPKLTANSSGFVAIQLDLLLSNDDNSNIAGDEGGIHPPSPPNHSEGSISAMTTTNGTKPDVPSQIVRPTYSQDWPAYNAAQTSEKEQFMELLAYLCSGIEQPKYTQGRPRLPLADMVYTGALKVYSGFSARRFDTDVREAAEKGYIDVPPSFNSVNRYISNEDLTPLITGLIKASADPLTKVETQFSPDATGFSTSRFDRWYDHKWGKERSRRQWLKAHAYVGNKTNTVVSVMITASNVHDSVMLPYLLQDAQGRGFDMQEVSADKGYLSDANLREIESVGARPYIPFKSNSTGRGSKRWMRLYSFFILHEDNFKDHYHRRSNVETTFSMLKGKFGDSVRAKSHAGQVNEVLLKFLCHNICVLNHAEHELLASLRMTLNQKYPSEPKLRPLNQKADSGAGLGAKPINSSIDSIFVS